MLALYLEEGDDMIGDTIVGYVPRMIASMCRAGSCFESNGVLEGCHRQYEFQNGCW